MKDQIKKTVQSIGSKESANEDCPECGSSETYYKTHANIDLDSHSAWCDDCGFGFRV